MTSFPETPVLAIDTSTTYLSLALAVDGKLHTRHFDAGNQQSEQILPQIAELFAETGGTHCCAMSIGGELAFICEDIGRHNAVDKAIGQALMAEKNIAEAILFTTGRIPSDMVIKAIRSRIPVIASHSAPTDEAVLLARQFNLTLLGFVRGKRMNLYTGK